MQLPHHEIHVWLMRLTQPPHSRLPLNGLSRTEKRRALAAGSPRYRAHFVQSRCGLRQLLGAYLGQPPDAVSLGVDAHGKPFLAQANPSDLQFNLAHTEALAVYAFTCGSRLGVDIDHLDRIQDWRAIARSSFSAQETAALKALPESQRRQALMHGWVRKEAYTKARGMGYGYGFKNVTVAMNASQAGTLLLDDRLDPGAPARWWIRHLMVEPPMVAALSGELLPVRIRQRWFAFTPH